MKLLLQALSKASNAAFVINEDFRILFWNEAAELIPGFTVEQATSRYCYELLGGMMKMRGIGAILGRSGVELGYVRVAQQEQRNVYITTRGAAFPMILI
jgi:PAS domain-containing protein